MKKFEEMLATKGSAAQKTLIDAMLEWWMAKDQNDAISQIEAHPGEDLAGIKNSVVAGLASLANTLGLDPEKFISEEWLHAMADLDAEDVVKALDAIHKQWLEDNFKARRWAEKFFKGQLFQYRKTAKLPWSEVAKDFLFIQEYLAEYKIEEIAAAFEIYADKNSEDDDLEGISAKARSFAPEIVSWIINFRDKLDPEKKAAQIAEINEFLNQHHDGAEIMEIMITAVSE